MVGGVLMLVSGYSSRGFLYLALGYAQPHLSDFLDGTALTAAIVAITMVEAVIALGGLTVVVGGAAVVARHVTIGRALIWLGGGAGFLGLLLGFGYAVYRLGGVGPVFGYAPYWVGLGLAVGGRRLAKGG
jgi:hypothetical protein